jgi:hypothetical protein
MTDPVKPLLTREMFASDDEFWDALIRMARTGRVGPVEPAPPRPPLGPICRRALGLPPEPIQKEDALKKTVAPVDDATGGNQTSY